MKHLLALALLCASAFAQAQTGTVEWWPNNDPAKAVDTQAKCDAALKAANVTGAYQCPRVLRVTAKPLPCPAKPPTAQTAQCVAPAVGTWPQTRTVVSATSPQCWVTGEWTPKDPPTGACVTPPVADVWVKVADETDSFTVPDGTTVRFGLGTAWVQKVFSAGTYACKLDRFGATVDPVPLTRKQCERLTSGTTPPPVTPPVTGSAKVSWAAPTTNADGTPLLDLAGYRVEFGTSSGTYTQSVEASSSPVTIPNLAAGPWFFIVRALDTSGNPSAASAQVSKTVQ